jgi:KipI family sensor histidine kinase inhibitor
MQMSPAAIPSIPVRFLDAGDSAVVVEFGDGIDPKTNARVLALDAQLSAVKIIGIVETVPTYRSLMVQVDPLVFDRDSFECRVQSLLPLLGDGTPAGKRWRVPVVYGGEYGIDLKDVAERHCLSPVQVIDRHAAAIYRVYMIGFMPGYTYLGGLDQTIATPRRLDPRPKTPAGTISIGGIQALIAGGEMPSGWHLLGRTPVVTFMARRRFCSSLAMKFSFSQ